MKRINQILLLFAIGSLSLSLLSGTPADPTASAVTSGEPAASPAPMRVMAPMLSVVSGSGELCLGTAGTYAVNVTVNAATPITRIEWDFGEGVAVVSNNVTVTATFTQNYTYKQRGSYTLIVTPYSGTNRLRSEILLFPIKINSCTIPVNHIKSNL